MNKINKHIEIVVSAQSNLSSMTKKSSIMIKNALRKHFEYVDITVVSNVSDLVDLARKQPDLAFIGLKKVPVNDEQIEEGYVWVANYLSNHGIITTGSDSTAIKIEQDKTKAKDKILEAGLATSPYFVTTDGQYTEELSLPIKYPLFLKPPDRGSGVGIGDDSVVRNFDEYKSKVKALLSEKGSETLVEKYLHGREFTVALMSDAKSENLMIMPIEQLPIKNSRGDAVIGRAMKIAKAETAVGLVEDGTIKQSVIKLARDVFIALGARDYGRIDMRLDENDTPNFLEANLIPGLIDGSGNFQKACQMNLGMNHEQMILHIVNLAFARDSENTSEMPLFNPSGVLQYI